MKRHFQGTAGYAADLLALPRMRRGYGSHCVSNDPSPGSTCACRAALDCGEAHRSVGHYGHVCRSEAGSTALPSAVSSGLRGPRRGGLRGLSHLASATADHTPGPDNGARGGVTRRWAPSASAASTTSTRHSSEGRRGQSGRPTAPAPAPASAAVRPAGARQQGPLGVRRGGAPPEAAAARPSTARRPDVHAW